MVEVPEYLLQRSRDRRRDLGATTGGEPAAEVPPSETTAAPAVAQAQVPGVAAGPAVAQAQVPGVAAGPAVAQAQVPGVAAGLSLPELPDLELAPEPQPEPVKPWVQAALTRKKIPVWAVPVLIFLPFWAIIFAGTLESPKRDSEIISLGREVYEGSGGCAGCHGAEGGGGIGPALADGEVLNSFVDWRDHVIWVVNGSPPEGQVYNDKGDISTEGMPSNGDKLSAREILAVVYFERVELGGAAEAELHDLEELFEAEGTMPNQFDIGQTFPSTLNSLMASAGIGAG